MRSHQRPLLLPGSTLALALVMLGASAARAQSTYDCTGKGAAFPSADFTLAVQSSASDSSFTTIAPAAVPYILDRAECECDSQDLFIRGRVNKGYTTATVSNFGVWAGPSCNNIANQTNSCERLGAEIAIDPATFKNGSSSGSPVQRVPVPAIVDPESGSSSGNAHACGSGSVTNSIWFLFNDVNSPDYCYVQLAYLGTSPDVPANVVAGSGDQAVTLRWDSAKTGSATPPAHYQVLCATSDGKPIGPGAYAFGESPEGKLKLGYSTCVDPAKHVIQRQVVATTSSAIGSGDMGTSTADAGTSVTSDPPVSTQGDPEPTGPSLGTQADPEDGGALSCGDADMGLATFGKLDKKFVCSEILAANATSTRITGLTNNQAYIFTVVAIDASGNTSPSPTVCAKPQPVEDLWRRYLAEGGKQQGFCFIATAAYGSYQSPFVMVLRDFRDEVLAPTESGAAFVAWYYRTSPPIADWIRPRPVARFLVRVALWPVIVGAGLWMWLEPGHLVLLSLLLGTWIAVRLARRRAASGSPDGSAPSSTPTLAPARSEA